MHFQTINNHFVNMPPHGGRSASQQGSSGPLSPQLTRRELRRIVTDLIG
jgi:hypothetical protein